MSIIHQIPVKEIGHRISSTFFIVSFCCSILIQDNTPQVINNVKTMPAILTVRDSSLLFFSCAARISTLVDAFQSEGVSGIS